MLQTLYLIRPHLYYASVIWNPYQLVDIRLLEQVQRRATRPVVQLKNDPYSERLSTVNLLSLLYGRRRMDMITIHTNCSLTCLQFYQRRKARGTS